MKYIIITCTLFLLINCTKQNNSNTDSIFEDQNIKSESGIRNESSEGKASDKISRVNKTKKTRDICAGRKDTVISNELDSLIKIKFPNYRLAKNSDFFGGYWCHFYPEDQSPYYVTGDFDGDDETEIVLMINKDKRYSTLVILIDKVGGQFQVFTITEHKIRTDINIEEHRTKYDYGLKTKAPFKFKSITSDTTYNIKTEIIVLEGFEEKADYYYIHEDGKYKELMIGC